MALQRLLRFGEEEAPPWPSNQVQGVSSPSECAFWSGQGVVLVVAIYTLCRFQAFHLEHMFDKYSQKAKGLLLLGGYLVLDLLQRVALPELG